MTQLSATTQNHPESTRASSGFSGFALLALLTAVATYMEIVLGGTVRATGSGEACPDWPTCHGQLIPAFSAHVLIEYSHRLTATLVSILIVALVVAALRVLRQPRAIGILCSAALGLLVLQVLLGGVTVLAKLPPQIVTAHLATATALLGLLTIVAVYAIAGRGRRDGAEARSFTRFAMFAAAATFILILTGSYVVGSDAGLACYTWPLCNGEIVPMGGHVLVDISFLHRLTALAIGVCLLLAALSARRLRSGRPGLFRLALAALAIYALQVLIGAGNVWSGLSATIRIAHLATAQALWVVTAVLTAYPIGEPATPVSSGREPAARLTLATTPNPGRRSRFGDRARPAAGSPEGGAG